MARHSTGPRWGFPPGRKLLSYVTAKTYKVGRTPPNLPNRHLGRAGHRGSTTGALNITRDVFSMTYGGYFGISAMDHAMCNIQLLCFQCDVVIE